MNINNLIFFSRSDVSPKMRRAALSQRFITDLSNSDPIRITRIFNSCKDIIRVERALMNSLEGHNRSIMLTHLSDQRRFWLFRSIFQLFRRVFGAKPIVYDHEALQRLFRSAALAMPDAVLLNTMNSKSQRVKDLTDHLISNLKKVRSNSLEDEEARLARFHSKIPSLFSKQLSQEARVILLRALEAEEAFSSEFYTVYHGQSLLNSFLFDVIRALEKLEGKSKNSTSLRSTIGLPSFKDANDFKKRVIDLSRGCFIDENASLHLLPVSGSLADTSTGESATYFMNYNMNISSNIEERFRDLFKNYGIEYTQAESLVRKAVTLAYQKHRETTAGAMYVFCIPKKLLEEQYDSRFIYLSAPLGYFREDTSKEMVLNKLNNHEEEQYRLILDPMMRNDSVKAIQITALSKEKQKAYKQSAQELAQAIMASAFRL